jgi:UDP-glucose 4-epimerase
MKVFISGSAGFIGSHVALLLQERGHKVMAFDNFVTGKSENLKGFHGTIQLGDITDMRLLESAFDEFMPDAVIHLAAQSAISTAITVPQHDLRVNGIGTINLLIQAKKHNVRRFLFSSTSAVYRETVPFWNTGISEKYPCEPQSPYGISKLAAEHYIRLMFPNYFIMRFGNVYGPRQQPIGGNQVIAKAFKHFIQGEDFQVNGHGNQKRDFVYVGDVAYACFMALTSDVIGTFNVSAGKSYSVNEILDKIENIYEVPGYKWEHNDEVDSRAYVGLNVSAIRRELGWKAYTSLAEGLKLTSEWWNSKGAN